MSGDHGNSKGNPAPGADRLLRGINQESGLRVAVCQAAGVCSEGVRRHGADLVSGWLISEALTAAVLLSTNLKDQEKFTLRWMYKGPVGTLLADTNAQAQVRGFPQKISLAEEVFTLKEAIGGPAEIAVITSVPEKVLRTGIAQAPNGEVISDLSHHLNVSFQVPTTLQVGLVIPPEHPVRVTSALGVMVQTLPGAEKDAFVAVRDEVDSSSFRDWLEKEEPTLENILNWLEAFTGPVEVLEERAPVFACQCSREKVRSVLRLFDASELRDMIEKEGQAQVNCHFCADAYTFSATELESLMDYHSSGNA